jgi:opacity protein-like surface antigen
MKTRNVLILLLAVFVGAGMAQSNTSLGIYTGYTMTAFEDQDDAAGTLPVGVQLGFKVTPSFEVGLEASNALGGFIWKLDFFGIESESTFDYTILSAYGKYSLSQEKLAPYLKGGVGYFMGDVTTKVSYMGEEESATSKIDPAIGFVLGGGVDFNKRFFAEFSYNLVSRKSGEELSDEEDFEMMSASDEDGSDEAWGMNTWTVKVGYRFSF